MRKKDITGYEGLYSVTDAGEVWSYDREYTLANKKHIRLGRKLKKSIVLGYEKVNLHKKGKKMTSVHRIVAVAFLKNEENKPQVNHIDGNKINNNYYNLEWVTASENAKHAIKTGLINCERFKGQRNSASKLTDKIVYEIRELLKTGENQTKISKKYDVCRETINKINNKKLWKHI
jgi:hypothetical protein